MVQAITFANYCLSLLVLQVVSMMPQRFPPLDAIWGRDSYVTKPSVELVKDGDAWFQVWQRHKGTSPVGDTQALKLPSMEYPPAVDFDHNVVLVVFGGLAPYAGYTVVDSTKNAKTVTVKLKPVTLNLNGGPTHLGMLANPYAFFVYPKTKVAFSVELPYTDGQGEVQWKVVAKVGGRSGN
jgi:hypothetical protein